ncbi:hypothetical protein Kpol_513p10 [Vanderwaltozyma polyspora DSM 70294]|uniref:Exonuclease V, mitochondrial n=1 Tax=Vanderwaltozyma polyspora (strain ATCC 22028 / DSM 70294 / BCRC 21397 / CBS 2163 / NBRC 10782 / NRRL Y-8283 / UCD 57-17) TaxID=436907 RepID=EXO5_VANPO|nr:uncharacterized protein Kpol_513p10 [Vanderwaltozyma polyspora DSM 70294]A7TMJ6.1 RecName: Full=Exonuclease V, mitochondrial; Short=Exo V; AltName: Full=Defects in morphology protein 1; Flags: Precursor [Vanderwaltozyma polyspora DSM 70294]EDO16494.1 hypothetical protein Kpol_513p10 [Vanderwaltozyma polyspora DSM 70294]
MLRCRSSINILQLHSRFHTHEIIISSKESEARTRITDEERLVIKRFPIFKNDSSYILPSSNKLTKVKKEHIALKIHKIKKLFGEDPNNVGYLNYHLPKSYPVPFEINNRAYDNSDGNGENEKVRNRLSVTKLLTKRWCELREAYDIYSETPLFEHKQIIEGKLVHQKLEEDIHPVTEDLESFVEDFEVPIPTDNFHNHVDDLFSCSMRLLSLFRCGEAREVRCHAFLDSRTGTFIDGLPKDGKDVLVSGIIDHLSLRRKIRVFTSSGFTEFNGLNDEVFENGNNFQSIIEWLNANIDFLKSEYQINVSDVKTRMFRSVVSQKSVLKYSKYQVMYYRYFLELLGLHPDVTYGQLLNSSLSRGFNIDQRIDPAKVIYFMASDEVIVDDMRKLRDGDDIGFPPFDSDFTGSSPTEEEYDMSILSDQITDPNVLERYGEFLVPWKRPVTLKYFAARLAQMYNCISPLLSKHLTLEYYYKGDNFKNINFDFNEDEIRNGAFDSSMFWFGKRDIEPIEPTSENLITYCKYCDYVNVCSWRQKATQQKKELGPRLLKLNQN